MFRPPMKQDWEAWSAEIVSKPQQLLTGLCDAMGACLEPQLLPERAMLCMLLSAVTAGQGAHSVAGAAGDRSQVRLTVLSTIAYS